MRQTQLAGEGMVAVEHPTEGSIQKVKLLPVESPWRGVGVRK